MDGIGRGECGGRQSPVSGCLEPRVVAHVKEDVPVQRAVGLLTGPSAPGGRMTLVVAVPGELDHGLSVTFIEAAVEEALDCDESEGARSVGVDLDECWSEQIDRIEIPEIHLVDSPPSGRLGGHAAKLVGRTVA